METSEVRLSAYEGLLLLFHRPDFPSSLVEFEPTVKSTGPGLTSWSGFTAADLTFGKKDSKICKPIGGTKRASGTPQMEP